MQVTDSNGHILSQKDEVTKGKFSFISERPDVFEICFVSMLNPRKFDKFELYDQVYLCIIYKSIPVFIENHVSVEMYSLNLMTSS